MSAPIPEFRYHPDPLKTGSVAASDAACRCCEQARGYIYCGPVYAEEELEKRGEICPWCIADGSAAARFDTVFVDPEGIGDCGRWEAVSPTVAAEVSERTPGFSGWQQERWWTHCGDAAEFLGPAGRAELESRGRTRFQRYDSSPNSTTRSGGPILRRARSNARTYRVRLPVSGLRSVRRLQRLRLGDPKPVPSPTGRTPISTSPTRPSAPRATVSSTPTRRRRSGSPSCGRWPEQMCRRPMPQRRSPLSGFELKPATPICGYADPCGWAGRRFRIRLRGRGRCLRRARRWAGLSEAAADQGTPLRTVTPHDEKRRLRRVLRGVRNRC